MRRDFKVFDKKIIAFLVILVSFAVFEDQIIAQANPQTLVASTPGESFRPQILVSDNLVYLVWSDDSAGNHEVYFSKSTDGGISFNDFINLSSNTGGSAFPRIAANENNVYVTWYDYTPGSSDIFLAKSSDYGNTFEVTNISNNLGPSFNPWISVSGDKVYIVWMDGTRDRIEIFGERADEITFEGIDVSFGNQDVLFATSNDRGDNFEIFSISDPKIESWNPRMIVNGDKVHLVWNGRAGNIVDIYFSESSDGGNTFSEPVNVSRSENTSMDAGMAVGGKNLYVVWKETHSNGTDIFFSRTADGKNFVNPFGIAKGTKSAITRDTQISAYNDNVYVVWYDDIPGGDAYFVKSTDSGKKFAKSVSLDLGKGTSKFTQIANHQDLVYVIWNNNSTGDYDVYYRSSSDGGNTFESITNISNDENESVLFVLGPQISASKNGVFVVFENKTGVGGNLVLEKLVPRTTTGQNRVLQLQENDNVNVDVNFTETKTGEDTSFSFRFFDSKSGKNLSDVNYSLVMKDYEGGILYKSSEYAKDGTNTHSMRFSEPGPVTALIEIHGIGKNIPYNMEYAGTTGFIFTVSSGFGYDIILIAGAAGFGVVIFTLYIKANKKK